MEWGFHERGHYYIIKELDENTSLYVSCQTCKEPIGIYTQDRYPKYRIAMQTATADAKKHCQLPLDTADPA